MTSDELLAFFAPILRVSIRKMFGGHGIYAEGAIFAIEDEGLVYLKMDEGNRALFEGHGMVPFTYPKKDGTHASMAYYALPEAAYDEEDLLAVLVREAIGASQRAEARKAVKAAKAKPRQK